MIVLMDVFVRMIVKNVWIIFIMQRMLLLVPLFASMIVLIWQTFIHVNILVDIHLK